MKRINKWNEFKLWQRKKLVVGGESSSEKEWAVNKWMNKITWKINKVANCKKSMSKYHEEIKDKKKKD